MVEKDQWARRKELLSGDLKALKNLVVLAKGIFRKPVSSELERLIRSFGISIANSSVAVARLCSDGFGADAIKICRSMFETLVLIRYLVRRPDKLRDFLDFDAIARHKRLQLYKSKFPSLYANFSAESVKALEAMYLRVRGRFLTKSGKERRNWSGHSVAEMAVVAGIPDLYEIFYPYSSSLHHLGPMGLTMIIDRETMEVPPGPSNGHVAIAARLAAVVFHDSLKEYSSLVGTDCSDALNQIDGLLSGDIILEGSPLGSLGDAFPNVEERGSERIK